MTRKDEAKDGPIVPLQGMSIVEQIKASEKAKADAAANEAETTTKLENKTMVVKPIKSEAETAATKDDAIEIFKGIPLPEGRQAKESKYKWDDLAVGEAFFVPHAKLKSFTTLVSTRNKRGGETGPKFVVRAYQHPTSGVDGVMVWRKS